MSRIVSTFKTHYVQIKPDAIKRNNAIYTDFKTHYVQIKLYRSPGSIKVYLFFKTHYVQIKLGTVYKNRFHRKEL